jgi:PST family polysaccharide transporter
MELLGQYTRAYALMLAPLNQVMAPIGTVLVPLFSRIHKNEVEFKKLTLALFISCVGITAPAAAFTFVHSNTIVNFLLGPGWEVAEQIFWWFGFAVFCKPLGCIVYWIFVSSGKMKQMIRWTVINTVLTVCAIMVGLQYGPIRVAALFSGSEIALQIPIAIYLLGKTRLIPAGKWYKVYILGLGLLAGSYCMLRLIQEKMVFYSLGANAQMTVSLFLAAVLSISAILANPESRNLVKDCKDRIF